MREPPRRGRLARDVLRLDAVGHRRDEEPRVVAAHLAGRGDPARPGMQCVGVDAELVRPQQLAEGDPSRLDVSARTGQIGHWDGEQHAGLLERLAHGRTQQRAGLAAGRSRAGPTVAASPPAANGSSASASSTRPPGKTAIPPAKTIWRHPGQQPHLEAGRAVAQQHDRRRVPNWNVCHRVSTISSTSTGASSGSAATPIADRACLPPSPKISPSTSLAPLTTCG